MDNYLFTAQSCTVIYKYMYDLIKEKVTIIYTVINLEFYNLLVINKIKINEEKPVFKRK